LLDAAAQATDLSKAMTETEIYAALDEIFRDVFLREDLALTPELSAQDVPGWDSFKQIDIILAVEARYHVKFNTRELDSLHNVGDLVRVIAAKIA
jgi:acyl carrier protein